MLFNYLICFRQKATLIPRHLQINILLPSQNATIKIIQPTGIHSHINQLIARLLSTNPAFAIYQNLSRQWHVIRTDGSMRHDNVGEWELDNVVFGLEPHI